MENKIREQFIILVDYFIKIAEMDLKSTNETDSVCEYIF